MFPRSTPLRSSSMPLSRAQTENEQPQQTQSEDPSRIMSQISESIDELGREIDADRAARDTHEALRRLDCAPGAVYDAQGRNGCMANTRVEIMRDILAWSRDPSAPAIFWLSGMAGTGKTSIAWSLCDALQTEGRLGGSFFCSRASAPQHGDITRVIPSLARLLALQINPFKSALVKRLNADPDVAYRRIRDQINFLLLQPLDLLPRGDIPLLVLVIDAMDECFDKDATRDMLGALVAASPRLPLKFFVTSRPEQHIRPLFDAHVHRILKLHQIEQTKVDTDIRLYFETTLQSLVHPPSRTWFTQDDVERLVQQAHGLFIFASTAVKYIRRDPTSRLPRLLTSSTPSRVATKPLDDMYVLILNEAAHVDDIEPEELDFLKRLLALVFVVHYPLSVAALAEYLCVTPARLRATLDHLHAVLHVPEEDEEQEVSVLHSSFADFLTSADRAPRRLRTQPSTGHRTLAYRSFARFRRIGEPGALDQAILSIKAVAEQTADTDPEQIVPLKSLAAALQARMSRDGAAMFAPIERFFSFLDGDLAPTRKMLADSLSFFDRNGWKSLRILGDRFERFDDATDQIFDDGVDFLKVQLARLFKSQARARASTTANKIGNKLKQWL